jgi:hypothetical protein
MPNFAKPSNNDELHSFLDRMLHDDGWQFAETLHAQEKHSDLKFGAVWLALFSDQKWELVRWNKSPFGSQFWRYEIKGVTFEGRPLTIVLDIDFENLKWTVVTRYIRNRQYAKTRLQKPHRSQGSNR